MMMMMMMMEMDPRFGFSRWRKKAGWLYKVASWRSEGQLGVLW